MLATPAFPFFSLALMKSDHHDRSVNNTFFIGRRKCCFYSIKYGKLLMAENWPPHLQFVELSVPFFSVPCLSWYSLKLDECYVPKSEDTSSEEWNLRCLWDRWGRRRIMIEREAEVADKGKKKKKKKKDKDLEEEGFHIHSFSMFVISCRLGYFALRLKDVTNWDFPPLQSEPLVFLLMLQGSPHSTLSSITIWSWTVTMNHSRNFEDPVGGFVGRVSRMGLSGYPTTSTQYPRLWRRATYHSTKNKAQRWKALSIQRVRHPKGHRHV